jgi:hypothetical protein
MSASASREAQNLIAFPSSSSSIYLEGRGGSRETIDDEDNVLRVCRDEGELVERLWREFRLPAPDARRAFRRFGLAACERSYVQTKSAHGLRKLRRPAGWFMATLIKGLVWTDAEYREHLDQPHFGD